MQGVAILVLPLVQAVCKVLQSLCAVCVQVAHCNERSVGVFVCKLLTCRVAVCVQIVAACMQSGASVHTSRATVCMQGAFITRDSLHARCDTYSTVCMQVVGILACRLRAKLLIVKRECQCLCVQVVYMPCGSLRANRCSLYATCGQGAYITRDSLHARCVHHVRQSASKVCATCDSLQDLACRLLPHAQVLTHTLHTPCTHAAHYANRLRARAQHAAHLACARL
jgi:hypothetical protein